jgi:hypothetical protein
MLSGLIVLEDDKYRATEKGLEFLSCYRKLVSMLRAPVAGVAEEEGLSSSAKFLTSSGSRVFVEMSGALRTS